MTKIIINADDFGISPGTNQAIITAYQKGLLTSTSIMPNGPAFNTAVKLAHQNPNLGIGIHLSLTWGKAILPPTSIPDLVMPDGYFYPSFLRVFIKSLYSAKYRQQVYNEFNAQIKTVLNSEIKPDHLNSQIHIHFCPGIFPIVLALSKKYKLSNLRLPNEPYIGHYSIINLIKWLYLKIIYYYLKIIFNPQVKNQFYGVLYTSQMSKKIIEKICFLAKQKNSSVEILTHPGLLDTGKSNFDYNRQKVYDFISQPERKNELSTLLDPTLITIIKKSGAKLISFKQL